MEYYDYQVQERNIPTAGREDLKRESSESTNITNQLSRYNFYQTKVQAGAWTHAAAGAGTL